MTDAAAVFVQAPAQLRGLDLAGGAAQQLLPQIAFELAQPVAHIGTAHAQAGGCAAQVASIDDFHQQAQGVHVHCQLSINIHFNYQHNCQNN